VGSLGYGDLRCLGHVPRRLIGAFTGRRDSAPWLAAHIRRRRNIRLRHEAASRLSFIEQSLSSETCRDRIEGGAEIAADGNGSGVDGNRNQRRDEGVLNGGGPALLPQSGHDRSKHRYREALHYLVMGLAGRE